MRDKFGRGYNLISMDWQKLISKIENMPQEEFEKLVEECDKEVWAWDLINWDEWYEKEEGLKNDDKE